VMMMNKTQPERFTHLLISNSLERIHHEVLDSVVPSVSLGLSHVKITNGMA
jgi:hypothetical protein